MRFFLEGLGKVPNLAIKIKTCFLEVSAVKI